MDSIVMTQMVENQYEMEFVDFLYTYRYSIVMVSMAIFAALFLFIINIFICVFADWEGVIHK